MKNLFKIILGLLLTLSMNSCESEEKVVDFVFENTKAGALLRQISTEGSLDLFNPAGSTVSITLEYQDNEGSNIENIKGVDVSLTFIDKSNSSKNKSGITFGKITGWSKENSPYGFPRATFSYKFSDAIAAAGITAADIDGGDLFTINFNLSSSEGNFGPGSANGNVTAVGGWYASPYLLQKSVVCLLPDSFAVGTYKLEANKVMFGGAYGETFSSEVTITKSGAIGRTFVTDYLGFGLTQNFGFDLVCGKTLALNASSGLQCSAGIEWGPAVSGNQGSFNANNDSVITIIIDNDKTGDCGASAETILTLTRIN